MGLGNVHNLPKLQVCFFFHTCLNVYRTDPAVETIKGFLIFFFFSQRGTLYNIQSRDRTADTVGGHAPPPMLAQNRNTVVYIRYI